MNAEKSKDEKLKSRLEKLEASIRLLALEKKAILEEISRRRFLHPPRRSVIILSISLIIAYAIFLRCLHLLNPDHYYMISADSYIFHRMAERIMAGQQHSPDPLSPLSAWVVGVGSGLAYPLAYVAMFISFISRMSPPDALTLTCKYLPPALTIVTVPMIFFMATKTHNWGVGLFSAFVWAILLDSCFIQAAGYVDRDGLSILLIVTGVFTFYLSKDWHLKLANRDLGWMLAGLLVVGIEGILFLEWGAPGPLIFLAILTVFFAAGFLADFLRAYDFGHARDVKYLTEVVKGLPRRFVRAVKESNWRPFVLIISLNTLAFYVIPGLTATAQYYVEIISFRFGGSYVGEEQPLGIIDLLRYGFLVFPLIIGVFLALRKRRRGDIFWLGWFFCVLFFSLFARRFLIYAAPAVSVLCGLALAPIIDFRNFRRIKKIGVALFLLLLILFSFGSYAIGSGGRIAPNNNWYSALIWLRNNTPEDAVVMTSWSYGYWIIDIANRRPVWDNSYQTPEENRDVWLAYCTNNTNTAIQIMEKYGASYLIFSKLEVASLPIISELALGQAYGNGLSVPKELENSLYNRVVFGNFTSESGLKEAYRNPDVVILELEK